jgi:hypothetical protein
VLSNSNPNATRKKAGLTRERRRRRRGQVNVSFGAEERALQHGKCARTFVDRMRSSAQLSLRQINCEARST